MGAQEKFEAGADKASGKIEEAAGRLTGDDQQVAEGKAKQFGADLKSAGEKVKDAVKGVFDK